MLPIFNAISVNILHIKSAVLLYLYTVGDNFNLLKKSYLFLDYITNISTVTILNTSSLDKTSNNPSQANNIQLTFIQLNFLISNVFYINGLTTPNECKYDISFI